MEPLAEAIRSHPDIKGIEVVGSVHKISSFEDDILLTLTSPRNSLPNLFTLLKTFASLLGLHVNPTKSKAMSVNLSPPELSSLKENFPFQWLSSLPYLGIHLTPTYDGLYQANFPPLFKKLTDMLSSWSHFPLSWFGRISAVHMTYLPKLLYLSVTGPNSFLYITNPPT